MYEEDRTFSLLPNQTVILYPGRRHGGLTPFARDLNFDWVHFRLRKLKSWAPYISVPKVATIRNPDELAEFFCRFISDQEAGTLDPLSSATVISLMLSLVAENADETAESASEYLGGKKKTTLAERIQSYIDAHYQTTLSTRTIANALKHSPDYLERVFRKYRISTILHAVHQRRIDQARFLLRTEAAQNINEIAFGCGFSYQALPTHV